MKFLGTKNYPLTKLKYEYTHTHSNTHSALMLIQRRNKKKIFYTKITDISKLFQ